MTARRFSQSFVPCPSLTLTRAAKSRSPKKQTLDSETYEIELLNSWIESQKPDSGSNPLAITPPPDNSQIGRNSDGTYSAYAGCKFFRQLPISKKTKDGLSKKYKAMSEIQRASIPHSLCGRDVLGAAKTGSGKTLAFIIPVIEKLYRERWDPEAGVGSIIISPTKELAAQLFEELKLVGKYHSLSAGLLIGGRKDVDEEKERVNTLNILVCTPGRLLQHMDETLNFDCSQLQVLVLDEADRILDEGFKKALDAIISQLPRQRQTLLFSATQTKSVKDLARLSLKDPEYISVHAESATATPERLKQIAMEVPLDQKLNMLWSFIRSHLRSKILVFLSSCKQVKFVYEAFKKLRPGLPLQCLHGRMRQEVRMAVYIQFCEKTSVLFSTDVASRGLDFPAVDWVVQVDCPEDIPTYIHRVGRTARFTSEGKSVLFFEPSEREMLTKLQDAEPKIPLQLRKPDEKKLEPISGSLSSLLVKYPNMQQLAKRAFITYLKSIHTKSDKGTFDVSKLPIEEFATSLGLPMTPRIRFVSQKKGMKGSMEATQQLENGIEDGSELVQKRISKIDRSKKEVEQDILLPKEASVELEDNGVSVLATRVLKKKKLKINVHRPVGTRVKYDDEGNVIPPLAALGEIERGDSVLEPEKVKERYEKLREEMKQRDKEDKDLHRQRLCEKRTKEKMKLRRRRNEEEEDAGSEEDEEARNAVPKRSKIYFDSDNDENEQKPSEKQEVGFVGDSISLADQEALALKLLSSMHQ